jgi:hypothetical protein
LAKIANDELQALEKANIIRKGRAGTWTSQGFVIKQKGGFRFVVNYNNVNSQTKLLKFPLARIDDLLDSFQGAKYFSTIDLRKGFHQFEIEEEDKHKLGFITKKRSMGIQSHALRRHQWTNLLHRSNAKHLR